MALSRQEQITALEEQIENTKGLGSKERRKALQAELDSLKAVKPLSKAEQDQPVMDTRVDPTAWVAVTEKEVLQAEADGTLFGYDPDKKLALIRK